MPDSYLVEMARTLKSDPGNRRIPELGCADSLQRAIKALERAKNVILISGFYIGRLQAWETDGPLGTLVLAGALERRGAETAIFTDQGALPIFRRGRNHLGLRGSVYGYPPGVGPDAAALLQQFEPDLLVAIERSGRARDGGYYNATGCDVRRAVAHFDDLFLAAAERHIPTIAVGDGGNELGFGSLLPEVERLLGQSAFIACSTTALHLVPCGVSNWGGYALAAAISAGSEIDPWNEDTLTSLVNEIVAAGAVDGVSGERTPTVDGLAWDVELEMFRSLKVARRISRSSSVG